MTDEPFHCKHCNYTTNRIYDYTKHNKTKMHLKHLSNIDNNKNIFSCIKCNFYTTNKNNYTQHLLTKKHLIDSSEKKLCICKFCEKQYSNQSNLCKHEQKCNNKNNKSDEILLQFVRQSKEIQNILIEQNKELQNKMIEQSKQIIELTKVVSVTTNITNQNTQNTQFNIQVFLNDQCKDAINIMDFIDSLHVQVSDLEKTGELGYINGITRILVNGLRKLDICKRPIHCTDIKRETVYIKDQNIWEKENTDKTKLKKLVSRVSQLNLKQLKNWQEQNPQYEDFTSKVNDDFIKLSTNAIGSCSTEEDGKNTDKIMKNVIKEVLLEKK